MFYDAVDEVSYITGTFSMVGDDSCNMIKWDGHTFTLLPQVPIPYNITTLARYKDKIYAGGGNGLASWDGTSWMYIDDASVFNLYVHDDKLYVAGGFSEIGGSPIGSLASWNDTTWSDVFRFDTFANPVTTWLKSVSFYQGQLYVAGNINSNDGTNYNIVRFDGSQWRDVGGQIQGIQGPFVNDLLVWNDTLYVGGAFREEDGGPGNGIAAWDGTTWHRLLGGVTYNDNPSVADMMVLNDELYVTGWFWAVNGIDLHIPDMFTGFAKWDGSEWCTLGTIGDGILYNLGNFRDSLYLMGGFEQLNGDSMRYIAKWIGGDYTDSCSAESPSSIIASPAEQENLMAIYPNPAKDVLNIRWRGDGSGMLSLRVYDRLGRVVLKKEILPVPHQLNRLPVAHLTSGLYLLQVTDARARQETHQFIKE